MPGFEFSAVPKHGSASLTAVYNAAMTVAKLTIRFDIDTVVCLQTGVPSLLELAKRCDVRFTFFVNMGRAIDFSTMIGRRDQNTVKADRLPAREKLGTAGLLQTVFLNPRVGLSGIPILERLIDSGHELGLHGGRNHGSWQHGALGWSEERVEDEVRWGTEALEKHGLPRPIMFASPGWTSPPGLPSALKKLGYTLLADRHGSHLTAHPGHREDLTEIGTGMVAEPGGVGFIENLVARRHSREDRIRIYDEYFSKQAPWVVYDHPALAGTSGLSILDEMISHARQRDYEVVPLSAMARLGQGTGG